MNFHLQTIRDDVFGGLIQVSLGLSKAGRFVAYTPHMVISGFMSSIGIIILVQILPFLGALAAPAAPRAWCERCRTHHVCWFTIAVVTLAVGQSQALVLDGFSQRRAASCPPPSMAK